MRLNLAWRMMAVLALLVYALVIFGFFLLLAHNLGLALLLGLTGLVLAYAGWLLFTGVGRSKKVGQWLAIVAVAALAVELLALLSDQKNRRALLAIAILSALYLVLFAMLRKRYWQMLRQGGEQSDHTAHFTNPYLIINPKSGNGRAIKAHIAELAQQHGIHVIMTQKGVDVQDVARQAVAAGADVLGISGGDGSIGAVAKVAIEEGLPMVVLPGGTRCHFARDLGLEPKQIVDSLAGFEGVERRIDAAEINGRIFLNNASFGLYADIVDHPEYREHKMDVSRNVVRSLVNGTKALYDLRFSHDKISVDRAAQVLVGINRYTTFNLFELGHRQRLDEGVLQVTAITKLNQQTVRQLLRAASIDQLRHQATDTGVYQWVDDTFVVRSASHKLVAGVDGEREVYDTPVKIRILPGAIRIFVPAEGERSRRKSAFSAPVVRKVWHAAH